MKKVPVLRKADNLTQAEILAWLKHLRGQSHSAHSNFDVTSIFKLKAAGEVYYVAGVNVENRDLTAGSCSEEGAIAAAIGAFGEQIAIVEGWIMGAPRGIETSDIACYPCGECRQRITQYAADDARIHVVTLNGDIIATKTCAELMPLAFSFRALEHAAMHSHEAHKISSVQVTDRLYLTPEHPLSEMQIFQWLSGLRGDVKVSDYNETTIWRLANGAYVAGVKIENAAYPSSTNVMAAAAAIMNAHFGQQKVEEVWAYGFYEAKDKQAPRCDKYYLPSGVSLQVLGEFVQNPAIKLHRFNSYADVETSVFSDVLAVLPAFGR